MDLFSLFLLTHENNEIKSQTKIYDFTVFKSVLSKYFRVLSDIGLTEFKILSDRTKFCRTKLFKSLLFKYVWYYFQSLKGKKYSIYIKVLRSPTKQRDDIKSNCCHI